MPWLAELVQSSEGSLDVLPVQCLCEFLLLEKTADSGKEEGVEGSSKELQDKKVVSNSGFDHNFQQQQQSLFVIFLARKL